MSAPHTPYKLENPLVLGAKTIDFPPFRPRWPWIGGDLQTLRNTLTYTPPDFAPYPSTRLLLPMGDNTGDHLWALLNRPAKGSDKGSAKPLVILVHGLTGSEDSRNIMTSAFHYLRNDYPVLRLNLRGAGPSFGRCKAHYHAGRSADLRAALAALPADLRAHGLMLIGVSLGGNVVLKFVGENDGMDGVIAAAAVCAPIDLKMAQMRIAARRNAVYQWHLLNSMRADARGFGGFSPEEMDRVLARVKTVYDFDDLIVAPGNGFQNAEEYYARSSAKNVLDNIRIPTLLLHPRTDPWVPVRMYLERDWPANGAVTLVMPPDGGHVGFHAADDPQPWHDRCIGMFFASVTARA